MLLAIQSFLKENCFILPFMVILLLVMLLSIISHLGPNNEVEKEAEKIIEYEIGLPVK